MTRSVPRIGRILDLVGLVCLLAGGTTYGWAWLQLRGLAANQPSPAGIGFAALARFVHLSRLSRIGLVLMGVGAGVAILAAVVARHLRKRSTTPD